jgi:hypothetical protein
MPVVVGREPDKTPIIKAIPFRLTKAEQAAAVKLDRRLAVELPRVEAQLVAEGLIEEGVGGSKHRGSLRLWYRLGQELGRIVATSPSVRPAERRFLWEAMRMHASPAILRSDRERSRIHFEYCYRLAQFPWSFVERLHWDDWSTYLDSRSLRREPRTDEWMRKRRNEVGELTREQFRQMTKELNRSFKDKDTEVFSSEELYEMCDAALKSVKAHS